MIHALPWLQMLLARRKLKVIVRFPS